MDGHCFQLLLVRDCGKKQARLFMRIVAIRSLPLTSLIRERSVSIERPASGRSNDALPGSQMDAAMAKCCCPKTSANSVRSPSSPNPRPSNRDNLPSNLLEHRAVF